ncbi:MAG: mechanosensitive ion channel domain-containing protein [Candidatus Nitrosotenuis sp.]
MLDITTFSFALLDTSIDEKILYAILSIIVAGALFTTSHLIFKIKLHGLQGSYKLLRIISISIIISELVYLGDVLGLFELAVEVIASIGVAFGLLALALQAHLKNVIAGIGLYLNPEINIGDIIEIGEKQGVITEFHLTKTTVMTEGGEHMFVPNLKFNEEIIIISPKHTKSQNKQI